MTLITMQARIHFASDVLEEALRAELEERNVRDLVIVREVAYGADETASRVSASLPKQVRSHTLALNGEAVTQTLGPKSLMRDMTEAHFDCIVAFGSQRAINEGRIIRHTIAKRRYGAHPADQRRLLKESDFLPDFMAIPGIDGLPDPHFATQDRPSGPSFALPSVIICDPTLTLHPDPDALAHAFVIALTRCLEALCARGFNPVADGLAIEGLRRLVAVRHVLPSISDEQSEETALTISRDLMAAQLSGAMAIQKGPGFVETFGKTLSNRASKQVDPAAVQRILLPRVLAEPNVCPLSQESVIRHIFGFSRDRPLSEGLNALLAPLGLKSALRDLDIERSDLAETAESLFARSNIPMPDPERINAMLEAAY
ncbi:MAG: iron-containing alcohol dehydrogenase [Pseudomonadota bacterium]